MNPVLLLLVGLNFVVGVVAIFFSFRDERKKQTLLAKEKELTRKYYEASVLNEISAKIGYELNEESFADTFARSVENLVPFSTISYAVLDNNKLSLKTYEKEPVGEGYKQKVKEIILAEIRRLNSAATPEIEKESTTRLALNNYITIHYEVVPLSYFSIPLTVNNQFSGIITITSRLKNAFQNEDISLLTKVVNLGQNAVNRLQDILKTEKGKISSIVASHPSGSVLFSISSNDYSLEAINPAARDFLGLKNVIDKFSIVQGFGNSLPINQYVWDVVKEQKSMVLKEIFLNQRYFKIYINPVYGPTGGGVYGVSVFMQDITIEKEMEKVRENFTNMVVHELRAPLTAIKGASSLLISGKIAPADQGKMINLIKDSSDKMLNQIGDLLDAAKIEAGKFSIIQQDSDLNQLVKDKVESMQVLANAKSIHLNVVLSDKLEKFYFDKTRIDQVITNLLSNSLKFTPENGQIDVFTDLDGQFAKVTVKDSGIGIPEKKKSLLFSKYAQVQSVYRKDGTGLGLFISRGIIESHGGKIWIESSIEAGSSPQHSGTVISFTLPILHELANTPSVSPVTGQVVN